MNLLGTLTDSNLEEVFDAGSLSRGREYAADDRVFDPHITVLTKTSLIATAIVMGGATTPYSVKLTLDASGPDLWVDTTCSCPVGELCKHGAALALTIRVGYVRPEQEDDAWQSSLSSLVQELAEQVAPAPDTVPVALEFSVQSGRPTGRSGSAGDPQVRMRPLRQGSQGRWVKSGVEWREVNTTTAQRGHHPGPQLAALRRLQRSLRASPYSLQGSPAPVLHDFGDRVFEQILEAKDAGVELLPASPLRAVELHEQPIPFVADVRADERGTHLVAGVEYAGRLWSGEDLIPIGHPAHMLGLVDEAVLVLVRPERPLPTAALRLLAQGTLTVPPHQRDALADLLAPLARLVPVRSPDESVEIPTAPPPRLVVTVTWRGATHADLRWEWAYAERRYRYGSADELGLLRDPTAEKEISSMLPAGLPGLGRVEGEAALQLALTGVPALREVEGVDVIEEQRPPFREAVEDPEISFELLDGPDGPGGSGTDWLDLTVSITVDGESVPLSDVLGALTAGADHLVLPSGLYLRTDRPELAQLRDVVQAAAQLRTSEDGTLSVGTHDLGVWAQLDDLGVVASQAAEWVARARALRDLTDIPRPAPTGVATELRHYQLDGFHWLAFLWQHGLGGILADDMGLGKTLQVLSLMSHATAQGSERPFLVVAPTSVVSAWASEAARHTPGLRVATVTSRADDIAALAGDADVVLTTYTLLRLGQDSYAGLRWAGLVLDEAHHVKNHQSKTYAAARLIDASFRLAVTGTPFENRLMELWSLLSVTAPGLYPTPRSFTEHVVKPVEKGGDSTALTAFQRRIRPFLLRRTKELVAADLPPKQEQVLPVVLSPAHRKVYDAHLARERQRILGLVDDFDRNRVAILSALTKLRQLSLDPALVDDAHEGVGSAKVDLLVEHLQEITAEGHRALVFSQFTSFLGRVSDRLEAEGIGAAYLDGRTRDRGSVISAFRDGDVPVFLISLKAGGVGLTLTEADYVFVLDPWWNPAAEAQAVDRAHRIGQERHVHVYRMISSETIEEKVMELKERKAELFAQVVDGEGALGATIDADDIRGLFEG
ncbi:DEAD/DEAH box helicase [Nocardioides insulae]|uniref:DEAD/DEAH box helicase n=1 Tax=Nocardioides insulae TaxID=394734 RepID=UPI000420F5C5|nr:DEAD/DEAH box helicase [Nocardioides insulae]